MCNKYTKISRTGGRNGFGEKKPQLLVFTTANSEFLNHFTANSPGYFSKNCVKMRNGALAIVRQLLE
jgi:hypothetical protein